MRRYTLRSVRMSEGRPKSVRRRVAPPEHGWTLGAGGLPRAFWAVMVALLAALAALILILGYNVYGVLVLVLAAAAAVNLFGRPS